MRHEERELHAGSASTFRFVLDRNDDMVDVLRYSIFYIIEIYMFLEIM